MNCKNQTLKFSVAAILFSTSVLIGCKSKISSSKTAAGSGIAASCSQQKLSELQLLLKSLQEQRQRTLASKGKTPVGLKDCNAESAQAVATCPYSAEYKEWAPLMVQYNRFHNIPDPGKNPCDLARPKAENACYAYNQVLWDKLNVSNDDADDSDRILIENIINTNGEVKACEQQIQASAQASTSPQNTFQTSVSNGDPTKSQQCLNGNLSPEQDVSCNCYREAARVSDVNQRKWRFDAESVCRNFGSCSSDEYLGVDNKCYAKSLLPTAQTTACTGGQTMLPTNVCGDYNDYVLDYQACQAKGQYLGIDGKCH